MIEFQISLFTSMSKFTFNYYEIVNKIIYYRKFYNLTAISPPDVLFNNIRTNRG